MSRQGDELRRRLHAEAAKTQGDLAIAIAGGMRAAMPVDTGWARANTVLSVGAPANGPFGSRGDVSAAEAEAAAGLAATMAHQDPAIDVHVANAVPYLPELNAGASPQAGAGFLEAEVERALADAQAREDARRVDL